MDLGEILRVMRSRWYIVVPMLLLAVGLGVGVFLTVPTTYTTYTMVSLLSSQSDTKTATQGLDNPFLNFNDSLVATADFLGRRLESTDIELQLRQAGVTEKYTVSMPENAQGPFLTISLTGPDQQHMLNSATTLAQFAATTLVKIQDQNAVSARDQIRLTQVIPPQKPQPQLKKKLELVIVAGGGMLALTFVVTFIVESWSRRRRIGETGEAEGPVVRSSVSASLPRASASVGGTVHTSTGHNSTGHSANGHSANGLNGNGLNGAGVSGGGNGSKGSKPAVGEETRVLNPAMNASPRSAPVQPPKTTTENDNSPEKTAIITTSVPLRGDRLRPAEIPVVPRTTPAPAADTSPSKGKAGVSPAAANPAQGQAGVAPPAAGQPGTPPANGATPAPGVPPATGKRVGSSTTYQSQSAERRGQDANRVNGN